MSYNKFHKNFKLNRRVFKSVEELLAFSETVSNEIATFLKCWFDTTDFIIVETSGSTRKPEAIHLKKEFMVNSALATGNYFNVHENTKALLCLSPNYIAGKMMLVRALILGWQLDVVEPNSHPLNDTKSSYDFCAMVPLQLRNSLSQLYRIKKLIVGGAVISNDLLKKLLDVSTEAYATYGMTETITHIAVKKLNKFNSVTLSAHEASVERSYFKTLPNIKITKDNRKCLIIDAPKVSEVKIITNDIVELISETEFRWLGRYDNIINSGGVKLIPERIEQKLAKIISDRFIVAGISDEVLGKKLVLIVESENYILNKEVATSQNIEIHNEKYIQNLKHQISKLKSLSKFEIPKEIYILKQFVETKTKKINRSRTIELFLK